MSLVSALLARKPIADPAAEGAGGLKRELGAGDLVMLAIGAIIGAGIFSSIGTAAAGDASRSGAGPALILSFVLLGAACALAALCYAELSAMMPQAGSAYSYTYATLGEAVAWIVGWNLILEYAVGNVAVAIAWSGYFNSLLSGFGVDLPAWLVHGYREVIKASDPAIAGLIDTAPRIGPIPVLVNIPAVVIVGIVTVLLCLGVKESKRANNIMVVIKLAVLALFVGVGVQHINPDNYVPFAPNGFAGIHHGAAIVFFAYIGFDAVSTAAEETKDPQRNVPRGILIGLAICTVIYIIVGAVATGLVPYQQLAANDPLAAAFNRAGLTQLSWIISLGAVVSMTAVLLVFQYGQPRILMVMARDGLLPPAAGKVHPKYRTPMLMTIITGVFVAGWALIGDAGETYDLTNIGTLLAFAMVCIGVVVLRVVDPHRARPFKAPMWWLVGPLGAAGCVYIMMGLPRAAWIRFGWWLAIGIAFYLLYGYRKSKLRGTPPTA